MARTQTIPTARTAAHVCGIGPLSSALLVGVRPKRILGHRSRDVSAVGVGLDQNPSGGASARQFRCLERKIVHRVVTLFVPGPDFVNLRRIERGQWLTRPNPPAVIRVTEVYCHDPARRVCADTLKAESPTTAAPSRLPLEDGQGMERAKAVAEPEYGNRSARGEPDAAGASYRW
jgi:hypothetical protein